MEGGRGDAADSSRQVPASLFLGALVGVSAGLASALFLFLLDQVTRLRLSDERIVYLLPLAGLAIGGIYERIGGSIRRGSDLLFDTIHDGGPRLPRRMAPLVLVGTVLTHLFGGSAGREGTALQMGAGLADVLGHRCSPALRRQLLFAGLAAGFGSVFGTPLAGAIFAVEVVAVGRLQWGALLPALVAAYAGDYTTRALGIVHTAYPPAPPTPLSPRLVIAWLIFALAIALCAMVFVWLTHRLKQWGTRFLPRLPWRMALGGALVVVMWRMAGTSAYLGLGVPTIERAFVDPDLATSSFALKLLFTSVTLGAGFLGGEVTPLFFIGASLGNALSRVLAIPLSLAAGVGLAALFGAAAHAPLALSVMAVELLGWGVLPHVLLVTAIAHLLSRRAGIYAAQR